jgi:hypothetical protein
MDVNDMDYPGEEIKIGGKVRHIKYTIVGLKLIAKKHGSVVAAFNKMNDLNEDFDVDTMDHLVLLLHAGLVHESPELTANDVENMLTMTSLPIVFNKILAAFGGSTPQPTDDGGSEVNPGE